MKPITGEAAVELCECLEKLGELCTRFDIKSIPWEHKFAFIGLCTDKVKAESYKRAWRELDQQHFKDADSHDVPDCLPPPSLVKTVQAEGWRVFSYRDVEVSVRIPDSMTEASAIWIHLRNVVAVLLTAMKTVRPFTWRGVESMERYLLNLRRGSE